jgi:hypothetical protein
MRLLIRVSGLNEKKRLILEGHKLKFVAFFYSGFLLELYTLIRFLYVLVVECVRCWNEACCEAAEVVQWRGFILCALLN